MQYRSAVFATDGTMPCLFDFYAPAALAAGRVTAKQLKSPISGRMCA